MRPRRTRPMRRQLARLPARQVWAALVERAQAWNVTQMRLTLSNDGQPRWRRAWDAANAESEEHGWAVAVSVRCRDGWACELRAGGDGHAEREFLSPAGLLRLLNAFAAHFADHRDQVIELADPDVGDAIECWNEQESQFRAA